MKNYNPEESPDHEINEYEDGFANAGTPPELVMMDEETEDGAIPKTVARGISEVAPPRW
ncbi:hypothetical protein PR002_g4302 [Phytophthora rubi]|uniref:Uncharacterized protein n=1 Tax=Phytophthora rubi TaxID=129364 RepID=A0A6A3NDN1_9STRA|nr:hypothetical protein PR002_g4302 [Phytophthora rubi]